MGISFLLLSFLFGLLAAFLRDEAQIVCAVTSLVCVGVTLHLLPREQTARLFQEQSDLTPKERFEIENSARDMLAKTLGGLGVLVTLGVSLQQMQTASQTQRLTVESAATERLYKAIEKLSSGKSVERTGGILVLGRILTAAPRDDAAIARESLCTHIREIAPAQFKKPSGELLTGNRRETAALALYRRQVARGDFRRLSLIVDVLRREAQTTDAARAPLDLSSVALCYQSFGLDAPREGAAPPRETTRPRYANANFENADLYHARWERCDLRGANFANALLRECQFQNTDLTGVIWDDADVREMDVTGATGINRKILADAHIADEEIDRVIGLPKPSAAAAKP